MTLNLVSPGVKVREVDLTQGRIDGISEQVGAFAGPFEKGPVNTPVLIETEQDLIATFGKPQPSDSQYEYWMSASNYLSYGGVLQVVRTDNSNLNNANAGTSGTATAKIESYEDFINNHQTDTSWYYAAKDPGRWANNLKVCVIDAFADQTITGVTTSSIVVGAAVTQTLAGRDYSGAGSTATHSSGFLRGIVTGVGAGEFYVKVVDQVTAAGVSSPAAYAQGGDTAFINATSTTTTETTTTSTGIATVNGTINEAVDASISGIVTTGIALGDIVTAPNTATSVVSAGTTVIAIAASTIFVDKAITGIGTTAYTFTRTSTASTDTTTNAYTLHTVGVDGVVDSTHTTSEQKDWFAGQKMLNSDPTTGGTDNSTVYWKSVVTPPGTSEYASQRSGKNDEFHVVVVDDTGDVTGVPGNILEKYTGLSKAKDAKVSPSENIYWKDAIAQKSEYIYGGHVGTGVTAGLTGTAGGNTWTPTGVGNWNSNAQGVTFSSLGNVTYKLTGGENYSATGGYGCTLGDVITGYRKFKNKTEYDINFLIQGPSGGSTRAESQAKAKELIAIAEVRKDCIACVSPHRGDVVDVADSDTQTSNVIDFYSPVSSSSYAVFDSGYKYVYDRWNNQFVWLALNSDTAGLMARTSINQFSWFSPAGTARGSINSAIKLAYNPSQAQRDQIYPKRINPVVVAPGAGIVLFGDRTGLGYQSAFDRINVRRLFLTIEATIERAANSQLFEFNDDITRTNFVNIVEPYLRDIKSKRGITDFRVICDNTNNTPDIIDSNQFKADIFVKPSRSINFIGLTFVATRTGISFEEVIGNV